ncbi:hypothetical protein [Actinophytocola gossypii]|uniref:ABC transporter permease n=1 Tax=Actinophytocola gossypii TaxID=2812003 RepID=A0ABT2JEY2_9PSEU|nr:hypothetical protein [Actinophytocola gossypii]MCT2586321.1 hypothetical protein [Actinophytocola gossypii]
MTEPGALLDDLRTLRQRVRADRRGYAFPLLLFGGLILVAPVLYVQKPLPEPESDGWTAYADPGPFPQFVPSAEFEHAWLIGWYWMLVIVGGLAATGWWYRRRALRLGVETNVAVSFAAAGAALLGLLFGPDTLQRVVSGDDYWPSLYSTPAINLPILFGSAALSAVLFAWAFRPQRSDPARAVGVFFATLLAMLSFSSLCVYLRFGFIGLMVIAVALIVLAWWERSVLLGVVATLFTAASVPANHSLWYWNFPSVFGDLGWAAGLDEQLRVFQTLLVPGLVLVVGGAVAALTRRSDRR